MHVRTPVAPWLVVAVLVAVAAAAVIALDDSDSDVTRASVRGDLASLPGIPLVLPDQVPEGYSWQGLDSHEIDPSGRVVGRSSTFAAWGNLDHAPTVQVCSHTPAVQTCPRGDWSIERKVDGLGVTIAFMGGQRDRAGDTAFWESVRLSDSLDVSWLDEG
ncbi:hypothetical protein AFL01nite_12030 [Aeromicrobium flavum]|uniref:Uncharacterized protein n=1 Tax=Aeromicrobium flavum TaxID=416568 RepID=A0A512HTV1_9ACTN|nr:DUF4148 domain-containing protein [Aeromicrobium flavum]GEO88876.1 hypothetical protein AFL01nite_12030 [Aeromicrobium flavum]